MPCRPLDLLVRVRVLAKALLLIYSFIKRALLSKTVNLSFLLEAGKSESCRHGQQIMSVSGKGSKQSVESK